MQLPVARNCISLQRIKKFLVLAAFVCLTITIFSKSAYANNESFFNDNVEIRFGFFPSIFTEKLGESTEPMFLVIRRNGEAKVVNYGLYFRSDNIVVHAGKLPPKYVTELMLKARRVIADTSRSRRYEGGPQDEAVFYLSVVPFNKRPIQQPSTEYLGLLEQPDNVLALVAELRMLWKKLKKLKPAYAYLRLETTGKVLPAYVKTDPRFKPIRIFPRKIQTILINAITNPFEFYPLSQPQGVLLSKFATLPYEIFVNYKSFGYRLTLYLPSSVPHPVPKGPPKNEHHPPPSPETDFAHCPRPLISHQRTRNRNSR